MLPRGLQVRRKCISDNFNTNIRTGLLFWYKDLNPAIYMFHWKVRNAPLTFIERHFIKPQCDLSANVFNVIVMKFMRYVVILSDNMRRREEESAQSVWFWVSAVKVSDYNRTTAGWWAPDLWNHVTDSALLTYTGPLLSEAIVNFNLDLRHIFPGNIILWHKWSPNLYTIRLNLTAQAGWQAPNYTNIVI